MSISADVFESFLGAIYLDQGIDKVREFLEENIYHFIDENIIFFYDYKSHIKEYADHHELDIDYKIQEESGAPHDKTFTIGIYISETMYGVGVGKNKKDAEQEAACEAIKKLGIDLHGL